jgi:hypothetical protein
VRTKAVTAGGQRRVFRTGVWIGRAVGWVLLVIAIAGAAQAQLLPTIISGFKLLPSLALGLVAILWIAGLEVFLHFFDLYLSRN